MLVAIFYYKLSLETSDNNEEKSQSLNLIGDLYRQLKDYSSALRHLATLRPAGDAFFDGVMVNAEQMDLRLNRQGLLKQLHQAMNRVADLSQLAAG